LRLYLHHLEQKLSKKQVNFENLFAEIDNFESEIESHISRIPPITTNSLLIYLKRRTYPRRR